MYPDELYIRSTLAANKVLRTNQPNGPPSRRLGTHPFLKVQLCSSEPTNPNQCRIQVSRNRPVMVHTKVLGVHDMYTLYSTLLVNILPLQRQWADIAINVTTSIRTAAYVEEVVT